MNELTKRVYETYGLQDDAEFEVFGLPVIISGLALRRAFLEDIERRCEPICERYRTDYFDGEAWFENFGDTLDQYKSAFYHLMDEITDITSDVIGDVGIRVNLKDYHEGFDFSGFNTVIARYNALVAEKNKYIRAHNNSTSDFGAAYYSTSAALAKDPNSIRNDPETIELLLDSFYSSMRIHVYRTVPMIINDQCGEHVLPVGIPGQTTNTFLEQYLDMDDETKASDSGRSLLLFALEEEPTHWLIYNDLFVFHAYPGCGLSELYRYCNPTKKGMNSIIWKLMKDWLGTQDLYPQERAEHFIDVFDEHCERMEIEREDAVPAFILRTWMKYGYWIYEIVHEDLLYRLNERPYTILDEDDDETPTHEILLEVLDESFQEIEDEQYLTTCEKFRINILDIRDDLLRLVSEDGRTVLGRLFPTFEEANEIKKEVKPFIDRYREELDFNDLAAVESFMNDIATSPYADLLRPLAEKTNRIITLGREIDAFLAEVKGRIYEGRQLAVYDMMRGGLLDHERVRLEWRARTDIQDWLDTIIDMLLNVFGEQFETLPEADARYFEIMENAWEYMAHLQEKNNDNAGFFKKMGTAMVGLTKKKLEPDFLLATNNGTLPLLPIAPNEKENVQGYLQYTADARAQMTMDYRRRYDPGAIEACERMAEIREMICATFCEESMQFVKECAQEASF